MSYELKKLLFEKKTNEIINFHPKENESFEIHFLSMFFKEFLLNRSNIEDRSFLAQFSKTFSEFTFLNSDPDSLFEDESIFNLFPSCGTHGEKMYGTLLSCERYDHDKIDLRKKEVYKALNKFKRFLFRENKVPSKVITMELIGKIWDKNPTNKVELLNCIGDITGIHDKYSTKTKLNYFNTILVIIKNAQLKDFSNWTLYWERGSECNNPKATQIKNNTHFDKFHFNDWLHHYNQSKEVNGKYIMPLNSFGHKMAAFINRLKEINQYLKCYSCQGRLIPDWNYGHKSFDSFRVTVFKCHENNCDLKNKGIYINNCTGCPTIIDSRENLKQCRHKRNICKNCYACCKPTHKEDHLAGSCPKCLESTLVVFYGNNRSKTKVVCFNCKFEISTKNLQKSPFLERFYFLGYKETSSLAIYNKKFKYRKN